MREMECICGVVHTFGEGEWSADCEGCGLGLILVEEVTEERGEETEEE